jgi:hypothetical protein
VAPLFPSPLLTSQEFTYTIQPFYTASQDDQATIYSLGSYAGWNATVADPTCFSGQRYVR